MIRIMENDLLTGNSSMKDAIESKLITQVVLRIFKICLLLGFLINPSEGEPRDWNMYLACLIAFLLALGSSHVHQSNWKVCSPERLEGPFYLKSSDFLAVGIILLQGMRPYLVDRSFVHHMSYFVGPAELYKQGFVPFWEIPSQYGGLYYILSAKLPFGSPWINFLIMNRIITFLLGVIFYFSIRFLWSNSNSLMIAFVTIFACYWCVGWEGDLVGPLQFPSTSGPRFLPSFILVFLGIIITQVKLTSKKKPLLICFNLLATITYALCSLWSIEAFLYSMGFWVSFQLITLIGYLRVNPTLKAIRKIKRAAFVGLYLLGPIVGAWSLFFIWHQNHYSTGFDPSSFIEYAITYKNGFGAVPITLVSPVWILLFVFIFGSVVSVKVDRINHPMAPLLVGTLGWLWTCASYYISRSHPNNIANLMPQIFLSVVIFREGYGLISQFSGLWHLKLRWLIPTLAFLLFLPPFSVSTWKSYFKSLSYPRVIPQEVEFFKEGVAYNLKRALTGLNIADHAPIVVFGRSLETDWLSNKSFERWLPLAPGAMFGILNEKRQLVYLKRAAKHFPKGGWFIFWDKEEALNTETIVPLIEKVYALKEVRKFDGWEARRYEASQYFDPQANKIIVR